MQDGSFDFVEIFFWFMTGVFLALGIPSLASASPIVLRYQNPSTIDQYQSVMVCDTATGGVCVEVPSVCDPGVTCSVSVDLPDGVRRVAIKAATTTASQNWSQFSNMVSFFVGGDPIECLANPICRSDNDVNGTVTTSDFGPFLSSLGKSWK